MTEIYLKDLLVYGHHGANPGEKDVAQRFLVNLTLVCDIEHAQRSDDLEDTLNWSELHDIVATTIESTSFDLVERLAQEIVDKLLVYDRIQSVDLSIDKLDAFQNGIPGIRITSLKDDA